VLYRYLRIRDVCRLLTNAHVINEMKAIGDEHRAWRIATLYSTAPSRRRHEIRFVIFYNIRMRLRAYTR